MSVGIAILLAVVACGTGAVPTPPSAPDGLLVRQLTREVTDTGALMHLQALQKIADEHGGNRAAGTRGYEASVDYVVGVLHGAGFDVSTPTYEVSGNDDEDVPRQPCRTHGTATARGSRPPAMALNDYRGGSP